MHQPLGSKADLHNWTVPHTALEVHQSLGSKADLRIVWLRNRYSNAQPNKLWTILEFEFWSELQSRPSISLHFRAADFRANCGPDRACSCSNSGANCGADRRYSSFEWPNIEANCGADRRCSWAAVGRHSLRCSCRVSSCGVAKSLFFLFPNRKKVRHLGGHAVALSAVDEGRL